MISCSLPSTERLKSLTAVRRLFADGETGFVYPFRYIVYTEKSPSPSVEVLFSVPKRYHKRANRRNLLRRRTKEAYRLQKSGLHEALAGKDVAMDIAFVYSAKEVLPYKTISYAVRRILQEVAERI